MFATRCPFAQRLQYARSFSTSAQLCLRSSKNALKEEHKDVPTYPYGAARWFKQSNKGLYGGARIQFGNNISERTETKSRRQWLPNVNRKQLYSVSLRRKVRVRASTRVLRTIDKVGGLDEYLLGDKAQRIKELGMGGWKLRCMVMATPFVRERLNKQRKAFGLPEVDYEALMREIAENPQPITFTAESELSSSEFEVEEVLEDADATSQSSDRSEQPQIHQTAREANEQNWKDSMAKA